MDNQYRNDPDCPIEDILYLIQQDDIENIRKALLEVINKSHPDGELYLYGQGYSLYESKNKEFSPQLLAYISHKKDYLKELQEIITSSNPKPVNFDGFKYLPTDEHVQVFIVENEHSNRGLLITVNKSIINDRYIKLLIKVYNQQIQLLRHKSTDSLTGLLNRQSFDIRLTNLHTDLGFENRTRDNLAGYVFALLDIDFFKSINDKYGHVYGDEVLILFSNMMNETFRDIDMLFRYGGEEFALLLNNVNLQQAEIILNRFRNNVANITLPMGNAVTVSIGYCEFTNEVPFTIITERADKSLYYSKKNGRNKTSCYEKLIEENKIQNIIVDEGDIELF